jgi:urease accessory protein
MKLSTNTDFTKLPRAEKRVLAAALGADAPAPADTVALPHDERHLRRKVLTLVSGDRLLVDLIEPAVLEDGDRLVLDDGRHVAVAATEEDLYAIDARDAVHLAELAWHIGNRHLAAAIEPARVLILRDHVIKAMLEGLGARVTDVVEPFRPVRGAYSGHGGHHGHSHDHDHDHGERDRFGRLPGDPHYGHNHA